METYPAIIRKVIEELKKLPGIGTRSAERLVGYFLKMDAEELEEFAENIKKLKGSVRLCKNCFNISEEEVCPVCMDASREKVLAVVEEVKDLIALERAGFRGRYHVLGGRINPLEKIGPEHLNVAALLERIRREHFPEILIAANATPEGETTAAYLTELLHKNGVQASRLAYGLPVGGEIEYTDPETLKKSIENRRKV